MRLPCLSPRVRPGLTENPLIRDAPVSQLRFVLQIYQFGIKNKSRSVQAFVKVRPHRPQRAAGGVRKQGKDGSGEEKNLRRGRHWRGKKLASPHVRAQL